MSITFGEARKLLAEYASRGGKCASSQDVYLFVYQVLQHLLYSGSYPNVRKFCFNAVNGVFTVPFELEVALKVKIDGSVATVWDKFYEWYHVSDMEGCTPASNALREEPNLFPTVYDVPAGGTRVGAYATASESADAYLIVKGVDPSGHEVFTTHKGEQVVGERLSLVKGTIKYTTVTFGQITSIEKSETNGYVQLLWVDPVTHKQGFLSTYSPLEQHPSYRRFRVTTKQTKPYVKVSVLGRIRLKEAYSDSDPIPFDNLNTLMLAAQSVNSLRNNDVQTASAQDTTMQTFITREAEHKRVQNGQPIEIFYDTSGGSIRNILG